MFCFRGRGTKGVAPLALSVLYKQKKSSASLVSFARRHAGPTLALLAPLYPKLNSDLVSCASPSVLPASPHPASGHPLYEALPRRAGPFDSVCDDMNQLCWGRESPCPFPLSCPEVPRFSALPSLCRFRLGGSATSRSLQGQIRFGLPWHVGRLSGALAKMAWVRRWLVS